jgi:hypothetical protein
MYRCRGLVKVLWPAVVDAWWDAWDEFWLSLSIRLDPHAQRVAAGFRFDDMNRRVAAYEGGGGNFSAAGTGSDGD